MCFAPCWFRLVLVRSEIGLCRQVVRGGRRGFHRCLLQGEHLVVVGIRKHRIPAAAVFALMTVNAGIAQAGIFVPLEFVHGIVHQGIVEYTSAIFALQKYLLGTPKPLNCIHWMQDWRLQMRKYMVLTHCQPLVNNFFQSKKEIAMIKDEHCRKM